MKQLWTTATRSRSKNIRASDVVLTLVEDDRARQEYHRPVLSWYSCRKPTVRPQGGAGMSRASICSVIRPSHEAIGAGAVLFEKVMVQNGRVQF